MKPEDFIDMKWRVDLLPLDQLCIDKYPELAQRMEGVAEFHKHLNFLENITNDQILRYIVYAYHKNSPFVRKITDVKHRKNQALIQAGYSFANGIPEDVQSVLDTTNEKVADMTLKFLIGENSMKFSALMMQMDAYYKYNYQLAYGTVTNIKSHTAAIHDLEESIEQLSHDVFSGDAELNNFVQGAKQRGFILTPEQHAHRK